MKLHQIRTARSPRWHQAECAGPHYTLCEFCPGEVAQISNLPYRRFPIGKARLGTAHRVSGGAQAGSPATSPESFRGTQIGNLRYDVSSVRDLCKVQRPPSPLGFTLIEMMVVVVLIGIVMAVIIPEMKGTYEDALLRSTSRELVNAFNVAYSRAVTLNQIQRVRLKEGSGGYVTEARTSSSHGVDEFLPLPDSPGTHGNLDTRISVAIHRPGTSSEPVVEANASGAGEALPARATEGSIAFYPDGTADDAEVELRDRQGFRLALRINSVTARVRIVELPRQ